MSIRIEKSGILSTIQDTGRTGFRRFGINPNGAMDKTAASKPIRWNLIFLNIINILPDFVKDSPWFCKSLSGESKAVSDLIYELVSLF